MISRLRTIRPLWVAVAAALLGTVVLALWFRQYWPDTPWRVLPSAQLIAQGRKFASRYGVGVTDWQAYVVAKASNLASKDRAVPPLSVRITYRAPQGGKAAEVGFDSTGLPVFWRAPESSSPRSANRPPEQRAATDAFLKIAGPEAASFKGPDRSMGDDIHEENYVWKKPNSPAPHFRTEIKVVTRDSLVTTIQRRVSSDSREDESSDDDDTEDYWDYLGFVYGLLCTAGVVAALSIYVLWLVRRATSQKFPLYIAAAALLIMTITMLSGSTWQKSHSLSHRESLPVVQSLFVSAMILCFAVVGRGISLEFRPKWFSLEQLARLAPISRAAGESVAAGLLFSPLLLAIPFLIAACKLFPNAWVLPHKLDLIYSPAPLLDSIDLKAQACLLASFGFVMPALARFVRIRWLRWVLVFPLGTLFFADETRLVSGPIAAPLTAGFLTLILFWFVWSKFDILALVALELASNLLLSLLALGQKGGEIWSLVAALVFLVLLAYAFHRRGQTVSQGDPLASVPALAGFRAEREKLQAEFSLARRAQQDMLPPTPEISGYSIAASCTPSLEVGGDLYDFLRLPDGRIGIGVADVSGKGVPAALYMTLTKGLLASVTKDRSQLVPVVEEVNRHLHGVTRKKVFVTMALGFLDVEKRVLECVRAGHNPVVWRQASNNVTTLVSPGGLGLGITASRVFSNQLKVAEMALAEGDVVVFYSDGITEAMNSELELFGEQRLMNAVAKTDNLNAAETRDSIINDVKEFLGGIHPQDDMTLVVLRVGASEKFAPNGTRGEDNW